MTNRFALAALFAIAALTSCNRSKSAADVPERSRQTLRLASLSVRVDDATIDVSSEAWRSFQPIAGKDKQPLLVLVRVRSTGGPLPPTLTTDGIYLMHGGEVFATQAREEQQRTPDARFAEFMVRDGPKWAVGDSIDVVVALKAENATTYLLRSPKVVIARVD